MTIPRASLVLAACLAAGASAAPAPPEIRVHGDEHKTYDCRGGSITIDGGSNVLTLRNCSRVVVDGGENTIDAGYVDAIEISGAENRVTWWERADGRRPRITNDGDDNVIVSRQPPAGAAAPAAAPAPAPAPVAGATTVKSGTAQVTVSGDKVKVDGGSASVSVAGDGTITIQEGKTTPAGAALKLRVDKDGLKETHDCRGGSALVNGDRNELTFSNCSQLSVNGSGNVVAVRGGGVVAINGDDNKLTWEPAADGSRPRITDNGKGNTVTGKR